MHAYEQAEHVSLTSFRQSCQNIAVVWSRVGNRLRERRQAARQAHIIARLAPHLRYDIGEIDFRPAPPPPLAETLTAYQQSPDGLRRL